MQEVLEEALARMAREPVSLTVAGRTDAGVHARGQVASHPGDPVSARALNGILPDDVVVIESEAADGFDARRDALSRTYRYRVLARPLPSPFERGRAFHWKRPVERGALDRCAAALLGSHDFTAFTPTDSYHRRFEREVMRAEWGDEPDGVLAFWIEADSFMRHMVRTLVGTMLAVAYGRLTPEHFLALLEGRPRAEAWETAPPHGLYLESVRYLSSESP